MTSTGPGPAASSAPHPVTERADSTGLHLSVSFDPESQRHRSTDHGAYDGHNTGRRRSSFAERLNSIRTAGGANSLDAFARSWQRAVGFHEIVPVRQSFRFDGDMDGGAEDTIGRPAIPSSEYESSPMAQRSLLREQLAEQDDAVGPHAEVFEASPRPSQDFGADEITPLISERPSRARIRGDSIFQIEPQLASPFGGSYGSTWGSLASRVNEPSMRHAGRLFREQQLQAAADGDKEREPLLVKQVQEADGTVVNVVIGQSTIYQTVYNSVNILLGVGMLALPLAISQAGWVLGLGFLFFTGAATNYTAKLLAKCMDLDNTIINYSDIAFLAAGRRRWAEIVVSILFLLELLGACVALVILFADAFHTLFPRTVFTLTGWKLLVGGIMIPMGFVPLNKLSLTSFIGLACCILITAGVIFDGTQRYEAPGSLRDPMPTTWWPKHFMYLPAAFGILMAPWGGHSVFPQIYRDMRHPYRFRRAVNITYLITFGIIATIGIAGYLMFGEDVKDEVTKNIVGKLTYPDWMSYALTAFIAIMPVTKLPLNERPIVVTAEIMLGLDGRTMSGHGCLQGLPAMARGIIKISLNILCPVIFVGISIILPDFDKIMSLLGSVCCFTICFTCPCLFHFFLFRDKANWWSKAVDIILIVVSVVLTLVCTVGSIVV